MKSISGTTLAQATGWMVMSFTELSNSVGSANFPWVVMRSGGKWGDEFYFRHIKFVMPLKQSNDYIKYVIYMHQE